MATGTTGLPLRDTVSGTTPDPTRTLLTFAVIPEMTLTGTTHGGDLLVMFDGSFVLDDADSFDYALFLDGVEVAGTRRRVRFDVTGLVGLSGSGVWSQSVHALLRSLSPAVHTIDVRWAAVTGTIVANGTERSLSYMEVM